VAELIRRGISDADRERCVEYARTMLGSHAAVADADERRLHAIAVKHADHPAGRKRARERDLTGLLAAVFEQVVDLDLDRREARFNISNPEQCGGDQLVDGVRLVP
jgi:hypothetical protein